MVEVTEADREAYLAFNAMPAAYAERVRAGEWDEATGLQIIAHHRHTSTAAAEARIAELEGAVELLESLCAWLLHRFGPGSPEGKEAEFRLARALAALKETDNG